MEWFSGHPDAANGVRVGDQVLAGLYRVGWAKRGPSDFISTNRVDAMETAASILEDKVSGTLHAPTGQMPSGLGGTATAIDYAGWQRIDSAERAATPSGALRRKLITWAELIEARAEG